MPGEIRVEERGSVATITLSRPEVRNEELHASESASESTGRRP